MDFYQCLRSSTGPQPWRGPRGKKLLSLGRPMKYLEPYGNLRLLVRKNSKSKMVFCIACARDGMEHSLELETQLVFPDKRENKAAFWTPRESWRKNEIMIWSYEKPTKDYPISVYVPWGSTKYIKTLAFATAGELKARRLWPLLGLLAGESIVLPPQVFSRPSPQLNGPAPTLPQASKSHPPQANEISKTSFNNSKYIVSRSKRPIDDDTHLGEGQATYKRPKCEHSQESQNAHDVVSVLQGAASTLSSTEFVAYSAQSVDRHDSQLYSPSTFVASIPAQIYDQTRDRAAGSSEAAEANTSSEVHFPSGSAATLQPAVFSMLQSSAAFGRESARSEPLQPVLNGPIVEPSPKDNVAAEIRRLQRQRRIWEIDERLSDRLLDYEGRLTRERDILELEVSLIDLGVVIDPEDVVPRVGVLQRQRRMLQIADVLDESDSDDNGRLWRERSRLEVENELEALHVIVDPHRKA